MNALGNFSLLPDGSRRPVHYRPHEQLRVNVAYSKLQALGVGPGVGVGVGLGLGLGLGLWLGLGLGRLWC